MEKSKNREMRNIEKSTDRKIGKVEKSKILNFEKSRNRYPRNREIEN